MNSKIWMTTLVLSVACADKERRVGSVAREPLPLITQSTPRTESLRVIRPLLLI